MAKSRGEKGQSVIILVLALGLVLVGGLGLVVDGANLYHHLQLEQSAADAAATATALGIFQATNIGVAFSPPNTCTIGGASVACYICTTGTDTAVPCEYARMNGFGATASDTVMVDFPSCSASPDPCTGYESMLAGNLPAGTPNQVRVTIQRNVGTTIIRMLSSALSTPVQTSATAAIVSVTNPVPMLITDPYNSNSLQTVGGGNNPPIRICGGPNQSIQVNSVNSAAYSLPSSQYIDLSHAGPADTNGDCTLGTGASFGIFGGPTGSGSGVVNKVSLGTTGQYLQPHSPILDPFAAVAAPNASTLGLSKITGNPATIATGTDGCIQSSCQEYSPGIYTKIQTGKNNVIFKPGVYFVEGGDVDFKQATGGGTNDAIVCPTCTPDKYTGQGVLFFMTGAGNDAGEAGGNHNGGIFNFGTLASVLIQGPTLTQVLNGQTVPGPPFYNIALWYDRLATNFPQSHTFGTGNGCFQVIGTTYVTPTLDNMTSHPNVTPYYQQAAYGGTPCSTTVTQGDIIVSDLHTNGTAEVSMDLIPYGYVVIDKVALVAGGPHP
jgi:hypothetical protein